MSSRVVSFRFLQAVTNPVTDDHVTVGLLHWDGELLRFASDNSKVAADHGRPTLARALAAIRTQVDKCNPAQPGLIEDVRQIFPVAEGDGALLRWAPVRRGLTTNSAQHFSDLANTASLLDEPSVPRVGQREISASLTSLGERYQHRFGDRIRVNTHIQNHFEFEPPLSWQNHSWHHTIPMNVDVRSRAVLRDRMCGLIGTLDTAIPSLDAAVLTFVPPRANELSSEIRQELQFVRERYPARLRLAELQVTDDGIAIDSVERMLLADVSVPVTAG